MQKIKAIAFVAACASGLAACGDTALEQGLLGAGGGAGAAILLGGSAKTGAVVGAAGNIVYCQTNPGKCN